MNIVGQKKPIVVQAVQHLFHPPKPLEEWPSSGKKSQIVFITRGLSREFVSEVLETIQGSQASSELSTN